MQERLAARSESSPPIAQATMRCDVLTGEESQTVALEPAVAKLKEDTEKGLKQPVSCMLVPYLYDMPNHDFGQATTSKDGKPYILFDPRYLSQDEIAHELFHWKLRTEGVFTFGFNVAAPKDVSETAVSEANRYLQNILFHRLFFARMRAMGFHPVAKQRNSATDNMLNPNFHFQTNDPVVFVHAVVGYLEFAAFSKDTSFVKKYGKWLEKEGESNAPVIGERIRKSISKANPRTEKQMQEELARDFTILFGKKFWPSMLTPRPDTVAKVRKGL